MIEEPKPDPSITVPAQDVERGARPLFIGEDITLGLRFRKERYIRADSDGWTEATGGSGRCGLCAR